MSVRTVHLCQLCETAFGCPQDTECVNGLHSCKYEQSLSGWTKSQMGFSQSFLFSVSQTCVLGRATHHRVAGQGQSTVFPPRCKATRSYLCVFRCEPLAFTISTMPVHPTGSKVMLYIGKLTMWSGLLAELHPCPHP